MRCKRIMQICSDLHKLFGDITAIRLREVNICLINRFFFERFTFSYSFKKEVFSEMYIYVEYQHDIVTKIDFIVSIIVCFMLVLLDFIVYCENYFVYFFDL